MQNSAWAFAFCYYIVCKLVKKNYSITTLYCLQLYYFFITDFRNFIGRFNPDKYDNLLQIKRSQMSVQNKHTNFECAYKQSRGNEFRTDVWKKMGKWRADPVKCLWHNTHRRVTIKWRKQSHRSLSLLKMRKASQRTTLKWQSKPCE